MMEQDTYGTLAATADLLPDGSVPTHAIRAVFYLDEDGEECYSLAHEGTANLSGWLGALEILKEDLIAELRGRRIDPEGD